MLSLSLEQLAAAIDLDRRSGPLAAALGKVTDRDWADYIDTCLDRVIARIRGPEVRLVFSGHFSSGKSTLLNALLRRKLLPSSGFPETGVPCWLRPGHDDRAQAITRRGAVVDFALSRELLAERVSLMDQAMKHRNSVLDLDRLDLTVAQAPMPAGVVWVDSPGINDTDEMDGRAAEVADSGDVLIWVVPSHHAFGLDEQEFLLGHTRRKGSAGVLIVVNVFLEEDKDEDWDRFRTGLAVPIAARITAMLEESIEATDSPLPRVVFVSARGAMLHPDGFGMAELRAALAMATPDGVWAKAARCSYAAVGVEAIVRDADQQLAFARSAWESATHRVENETRRAERAQQGLRGDIASLVSLALDRIDIGIQQARNDVLDLIDTSALGYDERYSVALNGAANEVTARERTTLVLDVESASRQRGMTGPDDETRRVLHRQLVPMRVEVTIPNNPIEFPALQRQGMDLLDKFGTQVAQERGAEIGRRFGSWLGNVANSISGVDPTEAAIAKDRAGARRNLDECVASIRPALRHGQGEFVELLFNGCRPSTPPDRPDDTSIVALQAVRDALRVCVADRLREAAAYPGGWQ